MQCSLRRRYAPSNRRLRHNCLRRSRANTSKCPVSVPLTMKVLDNSSRSVASMR